LSDSQILKRYALRVKKFERIDLFLREGTLESSNRATYISLTVVVNEKKLTININKQMAALLSVHLQQLIMLGSEKDYEKLTKIYPDQESWHVY